MVSAPQLGGTVPAHDDWGRTSVPGVSVAGDVSGIEEASSAMIGGRLAGLGSALAMGYLQDGGFREASVALLESLDKLRHGSFGDRIRSGKQQLREALPETPREIAS